jgi:16S rRNA (adenine1518-N6/adenine1519-N6)-dimethyltransferase
VPARTVVERSHNASRRLGQNFLVQARAAERIVAALDPGPDDAVLEIGPGRAALTSRLIRRASRVVAVEIDGRLVDELRRRQDPGRLMVLHDDILSLDLSDVAARAGLSRATRWVVAGNLPYGISKPVAMKLVAERERVARAVLMFQREVARRLTARPGGREYGPLTVLAGFVYEIAPLFELGPGAFRPRPKVSSSVTLWLPRSDPALTRELEPRLRACLSACFARRRQTLRNNLRAALRSAAAADDLLRAANLDGSLRAERVDPGGFLDLARHWTEAVEPAERR